MLRVRETTELVRDCPLEAPRVLVGEHEFVILEKVFSVSKRRPEDVNVRTHQCDIEHAPLAMLRELWVRFDPVPHVRIDGDHFILLRRRHVQEVVIMTIGEPPVRLGGARRQNVAQAGASRFRHVNERKEQVVPAPSDLFRKALTQVNAACRGAIA